MRIWLVRHGESDGNLLGTLQGCRLDTALTGNGRRQAVALSIRLSAEHVDAVVSSPMVRSRETAETVAAPHGLGVSLDVDLVEFDWGQWTGLPLDDELERLVSQLRARWRSGDVDVRPPGGESPVSAGERVKRALSRLAASGARAPVVVAHGRTNRILMAVLLGRDLSRMDEVKQRNGSLSAFEWDGNRPASPVLLDDIAHLRDIPTSAGVIDAIR